MTQIKWYVVLLCFCSIGLTSCRQHRIPKQISFVKSNPSLQKSERISMPHFNEEAIESTTLSLLDIVSNLPSDNIILQHIGYVISYNKETKNPNWVAWHLTAEHTDGPFPRSGEPYFENGEACGIGKINAVILRGDYFVDMEIEEPRPDFDDWSEMPTGMSHGHICPAGDNKWSKAAMNQSFLLTNMCPQDVSLNGGGWKKLEDKCRDWAKKYDDIYIVAGPIFYDEVRRSFGKNKIGIPDAFFKVVLSVNGTPKAIGFIYSNDGTSQSMAKSARSVDEVEEITGFDFFYNLPDSIEDDIESQNNLKDWK